MRCRVIWCNAAPFQVDLVNWSMLEKNLPRAQQRSVVNVPAKDAQKCLSSMPGAPRSLVSSEAGACQLLHWSRLGPAEGLGALGAVQGFLLCTTV